MPLWFGADAADGSTRRVEPNASPESGRGLPHSKTLARSTRRTDLPKLLDCGSTVPLLADFNRRKIFTAPFRSCRDCWCFLLEHFLEPFGSIVRLR
jgi:hypothetical protein